MQIDLNTDEGKRIKQLVQWRLSGDVMALQVDDELVELVCRKVVDQL